MATVQHLTTNIVGSTHRITWGPLTSVNLDGSAVDAPDHTFKEVQVIGTFDGATVTIQGSLDGGTTWATLNDPQGNALTFTTARLERIQESTARVRPLASGAGALTSVTVVMVEKQETVTS